MCFILITKMAIADIKIKKAIKNACEFLKKTQNNNGSWSVEMVLHGAPAWYQKPVVLTSQCVQALIYAADITYLPQISKGLHFCLTKEVEDRDRVDVWAWKSLALKYSNAPIYKKEFHKLVKVVADRQTQAGCWRIFPSTFNLTNFSCILALENSKFKKHLQQARRWFKKNLAKDGKGWGIDDNAAESAVSFTSNVAMALLATGENPMHAELQKARSFIENSQLKNNCWSSSKATTTEPTTYATAIALETLMRLSDDPFNKKLEKGISRLLKSQAKDGGWPLVINEKETSVFYPTFYVIRVLSFYLYLKKQMERKEIKSLSKNVTYPQYVIAYLFDKFEQNVAKTFQYSVFSYTLNSRVLGITPRAIARRKEILKILGKKTDLGIADIIDELKKLPQYEFLNKKSHITQIKSDIEYLKSLKLIGTTINDSYYTTYSVLS